MTPAVCALLFTAMWFGGFTCGRFYEYERAMKVITALREGK